jgi:hypothetical protein
MKKSLQEILKNQKRLKLIKRMMLPVACAIKLFTLVIFNLQSQAGSFYTCKLRVQVLNLGVSVEVYPSVLSYLKRLLGWVSSKYLVDHLLLPNTLAYYGQKVCVTAVKSFNELVLR